MTLPCSGPLSSNQPNDFGVVGGGGGSVADVFELGGMLGTATLGLAAIMDVAAGGLDIGTGVPALSAMAVVHMEAVKAGPELSVAFALLMTAPESAKGRAARIKKSRCLGDIVLM